MICVRMVKTISTSLYFITYTYTKKRQISTIKAKINFQRCDADNTATTKKRPFITEFLITFTLAIIVNSASAHTRIGRETLDFPAATLVEATRRTIVVAAAIVAFAVTVSLTCCQGAGAHLHILMGQGGAGHGEEGDDPELHCLEWWISMRVMGTGQYGIRWMYCVGIVKLGSLVWIENV